MLGIPGCNDRDRVGRRCIWYDQDVIWDVCTVDRGMAKTLWEEYPHILHADESVRKSIRGIALVRKYFNILQAYKWVLAYRQKPREAAFEIRG